MNLASSIRNALLGLGLLSLTACQTTLTTEQIKQLESRTASEVCGLWEGLTYDSLSDTPITINGIRINNAKRNAYCENTAPRR